MDIDREVTRLEKEYNGKELQSALLRLQSHRDTMDLRYPDAVFLQPAVTENIRNEIWLDMKVNLNFLHEGS